MVTVTVDIPRIYRTAADLIEQHGLAPDEAEVGPDGSLAVDAACRVAAGLRPRAADLHSSDQTTDNAIVAALIVDLGVLPAAWTGDVATTVRLLRDGADWRTTMFPEDLSDLVSVGQPMFADGGYFAVGTAAYGRR